MKKENEQSKKNNEPDINNDKFEISLRGVVFAIIFSSVCIAGIAALSSYQALGDYTVAWAIAGFSLITALLIFFSVSFIFDKGVESGLERSKNMSPEQYSANLSKMIIGVILLFISVICGYLFKSYANFFGIMVVLAVGLLSEGHHEEIVANKKFTALRPNQSLRSNEGSLSTKIIQLSPKALDQQSAEQAEALFSQGEARQAYRHLYDFIALHEMDSKSRTVLAGHLLLAKRLAEAGDILVGGKTETHPDLRQIKARWLVAKGEHKLALYTLSSNQPDISEYPAYYELMASYYQRFGYSKKALLTYSQLVQFDGSVANWWAGLAISSDQEKQWESARFAYQQAFELPGLNPKLVEFVKSRLANLSQN